MAGFSFRLQPVLDYRKREEEVLKRDLARAKQEEKEAEAALADLSKLLKDAQVHTAMAQRSELDISELTTLRDYMGKVKRDVMTQSDFVNELTSIVDRKTALAAEGMKARKIVERLRDKWEESYTAEAKRADQRLMDEMAANLIRKAVTT